MTTCLPDLPHPNRIQEEEANLFPSSSTRSKKQPGSAHLHCSPSEDRFSWQEQIPFQRKGKGRRLTRFFPTPFNSWLPFLQDLRWVYSTCKPPHYKSTTCDLLQCMRPQRACPEFSGLCVTTFPFTPRILILITTNLKKLKQAPMQKTFPILLTPTTIRHSKPEPSEQNNWLQNCSHSPLESGTTYTSWLPPPKTRVTKLGLSKCS